MKHYNDLGFFDFEDFDEELSEEQLYAVNGGTCAGGYNPPSNIGNCAGGSPSGGGYNPPSYSGTCAGGAPGRNNKPAVLPPSPPYSGCGGNYVGPSNIFRRIAQSIVDNWKKQYNFETGYQCDDWVEEVLNDAGLDSSRYLKAGCADSNYVQNHIDKLVSVGKKGVDYTMVLPEKNGIYVVFMDDGKIKGVPARDHCGLLFVNNGEKTLYHNSSSNGGTAVYKTNSDGKSYIAYYDQGVGSQTVTSKDNGKTLSGWCYSTYYYQEIKNY